MAIELNQIWEFPIKDFHPFPNAKIGVGAHDMIGVEAKDLGMTRVLLMTTGLRGSGIIEELTGKKADVKYGPPNLADMFTNWADVSKAREMLDWQPQVTLKEGVGHLIDWYNRERGWARDVLTP